MTLAAIGELKAKMTPARLQYRPDIDGLRAIAIVPVVLCHFGVPGFEGGFVGVDIFFVISGFLITSIIHPEAQAGDFSLLSFYERRVRRILPALFAVVAASIVVATLFFLPYDLKDFGKSVVTTMFFVSNVGFWQETGYFQALQIPKPLLHTWSLAVEEQFYVLYPLLLVALGRFWRRSVLVVLRVGTISSLILSIWAVHSHPAMAYWSAPTRAWELGIGAVLAVAGPHSPSKAINRDILLIVGLALVFWAIFTFSDATPFPGLNALFPCIGAALIIFAGSTPGNRVGEILRMRPLVFIGLISYSLYLWHWPINVFVRYISSTGPPMRLEPSIKVVAIGFSFLAAVISWHVIERPFRGKDGLFKRSKLFWLAGAATLFLGTLGAIMFLSGGLPQRMSPDGLRRANRFLAAADDASPLQEQCFNHISVELAREGKLCSFGSKGVEPDFILWGDSHADALLPGIQQLAVAHHRAGIVGAKAGCAPLSQVEYNDCGLFNEAVLNVALRKSVRDVFLMAMWGQNANGTANDSDRPTQILTDKDTPLSFYPHAEGNAPVFRRGLERLIKTLTAAHKRVVIIGSVPELRYWAPDAMAKNVLWKSNVDIRTDTAAFLQRQKNAFDVFESLKRKYGVTVVYPHRAICDERKCEVLADGKLLYRDIHHLTAFGARHIAPALDASLFPSGNRH